MGYINSSCNNLVLIIDILYCQAFHLQRDYIHAHWSNTLWLYSMLNQANSYFLSSDVKRSISLRFILDDCPCFSRAISSPSNSEWNILMCENETGGHILLLMGCYLKLMSSYLQESCRKIRYHSQPNVRKDKSTEEREKHLSLCMTTIFWVTRINWYEMGRDAASRGQLTCQYHRWFLNNVGDRSANPPCNSKSDHNQPPASPSPPPQLNY